MHGKRRRDWLGDISHVDLSRWTDPTPEEAFSYSEKIARKIFEDIRQNIDAAFYVDSYIDGEMGPFIQIDLVEEISMIAFFSELRWVWPSDVFPNGPSSEGQANDLRNGGMKSVDDALRFFQRMVKEAESEKRKIAALVNAWDARDNTPGDQ